MRIALVQFQPVEDLDRNVEISIEKMREAAAAGAELVCFPEVQLSPFFPQYPGRDASQWLISAEHRAIERLRAACRELELVAFPNVYLEEQGHAYDASLTISETGEILGVSKMVHVVQMPCFYEQDYYAPSDTGFHVFDTRVGRVGVVVCFDRHFPESTRTCTLRGAELIVIPTVNTKDEDLDLFAAELRVAAMQNGVYIAMCNRSGREGAMEFAGRSIVVGPAGEVIAQAGDAEQILYADLDLARVPIERERRPYLELRRPEMYTDRSG